VLPAAWRAAQIELVQTKTANHQQLVAGASVDVIAYVTSLLRLTGVLERAKGIEPSYAAWEAAMILASPLKSTKAGVVKSQKYP
jgi:hypothetical protein